jgi:hypothetical protein
MFMRLVFKSLMFFLFSVLFLTRWSGISLAQTSTASFSVNPQSGSFSDSFSVDIKVTTSTGTSVTTLRADVVYPSALLEVTSLDFTTGSLVTSLNGTWLTHDYSTPGTVSLSATVSTPYTGQSGQFAKITFKIKGSGTAVLSFGNTSAIYLYQPGATTPTNILSNPVGATYTVSTSGGSGGTTPTSTPTLTPTPISTTSSSGGNLPNAGDPFPTFLLLSLGFTFVLLGGRKLLASSL